jgi:hypothetical protein
VRSDVFGKLSVLTVCPPFFFNVAEENLVGFHKAAASEFRHHRDQHIAPLAGGSDSNFEKYFVLQVI